METPPPPITRTEAQRKALEEYNTACRDLASAAAQLKEAQETYSAAMERYQRAYGAARQAGVA
jgi:hypothetical protein